MLKEIGILVFVTIIGLTTAQEGLCAQCTSNDVDGINCILGIDLPSLPCFDANPSTCFVRIDEDGNTIRGCTNSLTPDELDNCNLNSNCGICVSVLHTACNAFDVFPERRLFCHQCTGTVDDTCGAAPTGNSVVCPLHFDFDTCFIRRENGTVVRGCTSNKSDCNNENACFVCNGNGCNNIDANDDMVPEFK